MAILASESDDIVLSRREVSLLYVALEDHVKAADRGRYISPSSHRGIFARARLKALRAKLDEREA